MVRFFSVIHGFRCLLGGPLLLRLRGLDLAEVFKVVGDGDGAVFFAGFLDAAGPDGVGEVGLV